MLTTLFSWYPANITVGFISRTRDPEAVNFTSLTGQWVYRSYTYCPENPIWWSKGGSVGLSWDCRHRRSQFLVFLSRCGSCFRRKCLKVISYKSLGFCCFFQKLLSVYLKLNHRDNRFSTVLLSFPHQQTTSMLRKTFISRSNKWPGQHHFFHCSLRPLA